MRSWLFPDWSNRKPVKRLVETYSASAIDTRWPTDEEVIRAIRSVPKHFATTTFYLLSGVAPSGGLFPGTLPSAFGGTSWVGKPSIGGSQSAMTATPSAGPQATIAVTAANSQTIPLSTTNSYAAIQFISQKLTPGTYSGSSFGIGTAGQVRTCNTASRQYFSCGFIALYNSSGSKKTTIVDNSAGQNWDSPGVTNSTTEKALYGPTIGSTTTSFTVTLGDYLVMELGLSISNNNAGASWTLGGSGNNMYDSGLTAISVEGASTTDAQSVLVAPYANLIGAAPTPPPMPVLINGRPAINPITGQIWCIRNWCKFVGYRAWNRIRANLTPNDIDWLEMVIAIQA